MSHMSCPEHASREAHNIKGWTIDVSMPVDGAKIDIFGCCSSSLKHA